MSGGNVAVTRLLARLFERAYDVRAATRKRVLDAHLNRPLLKPKWQLASIEHGDAFRTASTEAERLSGFNQSG